MICLREALLATRAACVEVRPKTTLSIHAACFESVKYLMPSPQGPHCYYAEAFSRNLLYAKYRTRWCVWELCAQWKLHVVTIITFTTFEVSCSRKRQVEKQDLGVGLTLLTLIPLFRSWNLICPCVQEITHFLGIYTTGLSKTARTKSHHQVTVCSKTVLLSIWWKNSSTCTRSMLYADTLHQ